MTNLIKNKFKAHPFHIVTLFSLALFIALILIFGNTCNNFLIIALIGIFIILMAIIHFKIEISNNIIRKLLIFFFLVLYFSAKMYFSDPLLCQPLGEDSTWFQTTMHPSAPDVGDSHAAVQAPVQSQPSVAANSIESWGAHHHNGNGFTVRNGVFHIDNPNNIMHYRTGPSNMPNVSVEARTLAGNILRALKYHYHADVRSIPRLPNMDPKAEAFANEFLNGSHTGKKAFLNSLTTQGKFKVYARNH